MRIACIHTVETVSGNKKKLKYWTEVPFGISMIASILHHAGHTVEIWVYCLSEPTDTIVTDILDRFQAELIACTAVTTQFPAITKLVRQIKTRSPKIPVILGGSHATLAPEQAIVCPDIDAICVGEGDSAILDYVAQLEQTPIPKGIPHFWIKQPDGSIEKNPYQPFLADLDSLPFMNRELWSELIIDYHESSAILIGRGCPYVCAYCSTHALKAVSPGKYVRFRSVNNIIAELEAISAVSPKVQSVYFEVETVMSVPNYVLELCAALKEFNAKQTRKIEFCTNVTVISKMVRNEEKLRTILSAMQEANFTSINCALESGSERMRNEVLMRPKYTNEELIYFTRLAREYHIAINLFAMIGLPLETYEDFLQTREVARLCEPNSLYLSIYYPYPGTKLYDLAVQEKLFDPNTIQTQAERRRPYLNLPNFPKSKVYFGYVFFYFHVYRHRWPIHRLIFTTLFYASGVVG